MVDERGVCSGPVQSAAVLRRTRQMGGPEVPAQKSLALLPKEGWVTVVSMLRLWWCCQAGPSAAVVGRLSRPA
jgi:hypothetical protein